MRDQASTLRNLIQRQAAHEPTVVAERARCVAFTSGKGGVGKSSLVLNAGIAAARLGARVCVLDANAGLSHIDVLCGLNSYWNASHVLSGARTLGEVILKGPSGINIISGCSGLIEIASSPNRSDVALFEQLAALEAAYDLLIVDAGLGMTSSARRIAAVADLTFLVTTPEPTAIADAYSTLKSWQGTVASMPDLLLNRAESAAQAQQIQERFAQTVMTFLKRESPKFGTVPDDPFVTRSVLMRQPFVVLNADAPAARSIQTLARQLLSGAKPTGSFWQKLFVSSC